MTSLPPPELYRRSTAEQQVTQEHHPDFVLRPVVPEADYDKMATVLALCNGVRDGDWPENWPTEELKAYTYDRLQAEGRWGAVVTPGPLFPWHAGFVLGMPYRNPAGELVPGSQDLRLLMVNPLFQKLKLGHLLLDWAADHTRRQGADHLLLWVQEHNDRAQGVYAQAGYVPTGNIRGREGVPMIELSLDLSASPAPMVNFEKSPTDRDFIPLIARPALQRLVIPA